MKRTISSVAILCLLSLTAGQVRAHGIFQRTRTTSTIFSDGAAHLIPQNNGGSTIGSFSTTAVNQTVIVHYSAECSVDATDTITWLELDILIDGVVASPTNGDNAFCTSQGTNELDSWVTASAIAVVVVPAVGVHTVQVRGTLIGFAAGERWRIDDGALVVSR
jgi:hypothetical protein